MKKIILCSFILSITFIACNNEGSTDKVPDSIQTNPATSVQDRSSKSSPLTGILSDYLKLKNALTRDNDQDAAGSAAELVKAFESLDMSALNADQVKDFTDIQADAIEHAVHIAKNAGNIKHQREHFETLSEDVYELVKAIGSGQKLYYTNCPMYNENKGANWLSETNEVSNPYLGQAMLTCGLVKEELN